MLIRVALLVMVMHGAAAAGGPTWCHGPPKDRDEAWAGTAENSLQDYRGSHHSQYRLIQAARVLCNAPRDPAAVKPATEILQAWMKESGLAEPEAIASIAARMDADAWKAEEQKLCEPLEQAGFEKIPRAHKFLFGCNGDPLWLQPGTDMSDLAAMVDRGEVAHDDLAHLAWMIHRTAKALDTSNNNPLLGYVIDQLDFRAIPTDAAMLHSLDEEPYKGNRFARQILVESMAYLRMSVARVEAAVAKKAHDPAWKEILITAPARGIAAWEAAATKLKDELARSDAEAKQPKADCEKHLRADVAPILKKLDHKDLATFMAAISDHPLVGLFLNRLGHCMVKHGQQAAGQLIYALSEDVRQMPGPRMAAYYAALDAVATLGESAPVKPHEIPRLADANEARSSFGAGSGGVIASVTQKGSKLHVVFVTKKHQGVVNECVETSKIDRVMPDGKVVYRQSCHSSGLIWIDDTPMPVDALAAYSDGVKPGRLAKFDDSISMSAIPITVFGDKLGKAKLVDVATFSLE